MTKIRNLLKSFKERRMRHLSRTESVSFEAFCNESPTQRHPETKESSFDDVKLSPVKSRDEESAEFFNKKNVPNYSNRPSVISILLVIILLAVLLIIPIIYLLHCFGIIYEQQHHYSHFIKEQSHYEPSKVIHDEFSEFANKKIVLPPPPKPDYAQCRKLTDNDKFDCFPDNGGNQADCEARGCCWIPVKTKPKNRDVPLNTPYCFYPPNYNAYNLENVTEVAFGLIAFMKRSYQSPYPGDAETIKLIVKFETSDRLRVKIVDPAKNRFEPPYPEVPIVDKSSYNLLYNFSIDPQKPGFKVVRNSDNTTIFDATNWTNFIFSSQFLQISGKLPSNYVYGIGEHRSNLLLSTKWSKFTLFNHDSIPQFSKNLYGSHPFYLVMENTTNSHGVLLLNSNAMDIILQPTPAITFRTIGGVFDFYFFLGPTPSDVISQYTDLVGRPYLPPYWALGFHLCRFGYKTLNQTRAVMQRNIDAGIPLDTQWNDLDYMNNSNDFTYDKTNFKGLPEFVDELHNRGMHYIPLIDPGVSASERRGSYPPFDEGVEMDIFVKNATGQIFIGKVWNKGTTAWPDFTHPNTVDYWTSMLRSLHDEIKFDGAWIDMNEPSNFWSGSENGCPKSTLESPPYLPGVDGGLLYYKTMCMTARHYAGLHYDVHNLYGLTEAIMTSFALAEIRGKRPMVISRATFVGHGHYAGHWGGDVVSDWLDMKYSVPQLLNFNMFGIPLMGADICGFNGNTTQALCNRWMQLGAFYPFSRNHNTDDAIDQDPVAMGPTVVGSSKIALNLRYYFLPYLYTLFYKAHIFGDTVARALFIEFPQDLNTYNIDTQFLWGSALMIIPVLEENALQVNAYLPSGVWYNFHNPDLIIPSKGEYKMLDAPIDTIPLLLRGGFGFAAQTPEQTTTASRKNMFDLFITYNENRTGFGELYWDDGDSLNTYEENKYVLINWVLEEGALLIKPIYWGDIVDVPKLFSVSVLGTNGLVREVVINGKDPTHWSTTKQRLDITYLNCTLNGSIAINWSYIKG